MTITRQPWASAIAVGAKRIETRSWKTSWRGTLLIHAGRNKRALKRPAEYHDAWAALQVMSDSDDVPFGCIVAVTELVDCVKIYDACRMYGYVMSAKTTPPTTLTDQEFSLGDYAPGRYGWALDNVRALPEPVPCRGKQGLWKPPVDVLAAVNDQMDAKGPTS